MLNHIKTLTFCARCKMGIFVLNFIYFFTLSCCFSVHNAFRGPTPGALFQKQNACWIPERTDQGACQRARHGSRVIYLFLFVCLFFTSMFYHFSKAHFSNLIYVLSEKKSSIISFFFPEAVVTFCNASNIKV